jgi:import receptor subunit TOM20
LAELPAGVNEEGTPIVRRSLAADKDIAEGEVIYSERPLVSALYPELEGSHCNFCLKPITAENKVECPKCDLVAFCSEDCRSSADTDYHQYLCSHNKSTEIKEADEAEEKNIALEFHENSKASNTKYPYMIARFLSAMVAEELSKQKTGENVGETTFGAWDHVDRFRYLETTASAESTAEISMLKQVLGPKVQGISEFLSDEIYLMLKGKMLYNAYGIPASAEETEVRASDEHVRSTDTNAKYIGAGLYKISTYIGQSDDNANVKLAFENDALSVIALKDIKKDEELLASYTLPVPKKAN